MVRATEFARNFARYQDEAIEAEGDLVVTSHDRVVGGYLSASELARYEKLKAREREVLVVGELSDEVVALIEAAEYGAETSVRFPAAAAEASSVRYAFLWSDERDRLALDEASKHRPCAIVVAATRGSDGDIQVVVSPITHRPPDDPRWRQSRFRRRSAGSLRLDAGQHWLQAGGAQPLHLAGLRSAARFPAAPVKWLLMVPQSLFEGLRKGILARQVNRKIRIQSR